MLQVFSDASENEGVFCVAGVAFGIDRAKSAEKAWKALYCGRVAHMTDLNSRQRAFKGISGEEADKLCRGSVDIINRYASAIAVVSCDVEHVLALAPSEEKSVAAPMLENVVASAYNCCTHWMMYAMGSVLTPGQRNQYHFETGDEYQGLAQKFLNEINKPDAKPLKVGYSHGSDDFASKDQLPLLQTADLVAWEWAKNVVRSRKGQPLRRSLVALMDGALAPNTFDYGSNRRYARHYEREKMARFFRKYGAVMRATSHDEVIAAMAG